MQSAGAASRCAAVGLNECGSINRAALRVASFSPQ
jgi:hypothetical protein